MNGSNPETRAFPGGPAPEAPGRRPEFDLRTALEQMVKRGASDLHLKAGRPPMLRINGELSETDFAPLRPEELKRCAAKLLGPEQKERFSQLREMDFAVGIAGLGRFRTNIFQQRGTLGFAFRAIPFEIPEVDDLHLPPVLKDVALSPRGLVLVTGVTGSGKSTTLASMIRHLNEQKATNIVTIEDPIEFLHRDVKGYISQREVGTDTHTFHDALRYVVRQDPDAIMLGEIRDRESMETALKAADTGHLVLSTLHTTDAAQTIGRIISFFPPHQQQETRDLLASVLRAVASLRLIPRADGAGRVPAVEVLINTAAIADAIRDPARTREIPDLMSEGRTQYGMQTFDQSLLELHRDDLISYDAAMQYASNPSEFALRMSGVEAGTDSSWDPHGPEGLER